MFGSIRWCVWSFRPSSPLRLPHLKCLLLLLLFVHHALHCMWRRQYGILCLLSITGFLFLHYAGRTMLLTKEPAVGFMLHGMVKSCIHDQFAFGSHSQSLVRHCIVHGSCSSQSLTGGLSLGPCSLPELRVIIDRPTDQICLFNFHSRVTQGTTGGTTGGTSLFSCRF